MFHVEHSRKLEELKEFVKTVPEKTGVYLFYDKNGKLLYIGPPESIMNSSLSIIIPVLISSTSIGVFLTTGVEWC